MIRNGIDAGGTLQRAERLFPQSGKYKKNSS